MEIKINELFNASLYYKNNSKNLFVDDSMTLHELISIVDDLKKKNQLKKEKIKKKVFKQNNLIGKYLKSSNQIRWEYKSSSSRSTSNKNTHLNHAEAEIFKNGFYFNIFCFLNENDNKIYGWVAVRILKPNSKKKRVSKFELTNDMEITTDVIIDKIDNWINENSR